MLIQIPEIGTEQKNWSLSEMSIPLPHLVSISLCNIIPLIGIAGAPILLYPSIGLI